jgi:TIR domain
MEASKTAAFWSYAHEDDDFDDGAIVRLAERVGAECALITGQSLDLFVDRASISWGEEWRARADQALGETPLLIPVLSPRYFARKECRRELRAFVCNARGLGVRELVLPILYVDIPGFDAEHPDELVALAARMQYEDWRTLRLEGASEPKVRQAVNGLAQRLSVIAVAGCRGAGHEQLTAILAKIDGLFPLLLDAVDNDRVVAAQLNATHEVFSEKRRWAHRRPAMTRQDPLIHEAAELGSIVGRRLASAEIQLTRMRELDPLVAKAVLNAQERPENRPLLEPLGESVRELMIRTTALRGVVEPERARSVARLSRVMRDLSDAAAHTEAAVQEANEIVLRWNDRLAAGSADVAAPHRRR